MDHGICLYLKEKGRDEMKRTFRVLGILFGVATIILSMLLLIKSYGVEDQGLRSWMMVMVCGTLLCNGGFYYLKNRQGKTMIIAGFIVLGIALFTFSF
ncbi:hypothetical protein D3C76_470990 [compost metagenome]